MRQLKITNKIFSFQKSIKIFQKLIFKFNNNYQILFNEWCLKLIKTIFNYYYVNYKLFIVN